MAARSARERAEREARRRNRLYTARRTVHEQQVRRRRRDDVIAPIVLLVVVALAITAQVLYFTGGPGKPVAKPSASASATASPTPTPTATVAAEGAVREPHVDGDDGAEHHEARHLPRRQGGAAGGRELREPHAAGLLHGPHLPPAHREVRSTCCSAATRTGDGSGGPGYSFGPIENAPKDGVYPAGTIAMANTGQPNSQGSQFFIVYKATTLPGGYTVFGHVTSGLPALKIAITDKGVVARPPRPRATAHRR